MLTATRVDDGHSRIPGLAAAQLLAFPSVFSVRITVSISCLCDPTSTTCVGGSFLPIG